MEAAAGQQRLPRLPGVLVVLHGDGHLGLGHTADDVSVHSFAFWVKRFFSFWTSESLVSEGPESRVEVLLPTISFQASFQRTPLTSETGSLCASVL